MVMITAPRTRSGRHLAATLCALMLVSASAALAAPTEQASLNTCQNAVKTAAAKYVTGKVGAIGSCLQAISTQLIKDEKPDASGAVGVCVREFRLLNDSRHLGKSLPEKLAAGIDKTCTPGNVRVTHTLGDILGPGATVTQPIDADNIAAWCANFGGSGAIAILADWESCIENAQECGVATQLSTQYPRALAWLGLVRPAMDRLTPPATDPAKISDAVAGLDAVVAELTGGAM